jgi:periplasmic mercuric ion binding protein
MTLALGALTSPVLAGESTVTLAVRNWYCAACPHIIKQSLAAVPSGLRHLRRYEDRRKKPHRGDRRGGLSLLPLYGRDAVAMRDHALITSGAARTVLAAARCGAPFLPGRWVGRNHGINGFGEPCRFPALIFCAGLTKAARGQALRLPLHSE